MKTTDGLWSLDGRVAIVTGASAGIGRATAQALASAGASVLVTARRDELLQTLVDEIRADGGNAFAVACDVSTAAGVELVMAGVSQAFGRVNILVNNIGGLAGPGWGPGPLLEMTEADFDGCFAFNVKSHWLMACAAARSMFDVGAGSIVNISSSAARSDTFMVSGVAFYAAAKAAVVQLTTSMAVEWSPTIRVNCIAPGLIMTDAIRDGTTPEHQRAYSQHSGMGRLGNVEEIAGAVTFLASDAAGYMTGQTLDLTGGRGATVSIDAS